ncbi:PKD domain-containing protein [Variovorax sp. J22P168]|uniref:PKD domain-containing protein n=1 Tax=Variovorax jilinensis TaxID=3053513 RepID=UPI002574B29F|nr:PKD domain-containing protein [Variovorax sp. J22P168]MDM0014531.1 PKD domain-containing protein [Variovorax sp. J22P168]
MQSFAQSLVASAVLLSLAACGGGGSGGGFAIPTAATTPTTPAATAPAAPTDPAPPVAMDPAPPAATNTAPVANAGSAQKVGSGTAVTLSAAASTDAESDALSYLWTLSSKPAGSTAALNDAKAVSPRFTPDLPGTYIATLVANDGKADSAAVDVTITVEAVVAFDALTPLPPNMPSLGFQATSTSRLGDRIALKAGSPRTLDSIAIAMSSWACESGGWSTNDCVTTPNATFSHPIRLKVFDSSDKLVAERVQAFDIPYRPSAASGCTGGRWKAPDDKCYNGFAAQIVFDLSSLKVTLPDDQLSFEVSYDTNTYGASPKGSPGPYDSLNVGLYAPTAGPSVGTDRDPGTVYQNDVATDLGGPPGYGIMAKVLTIAP